MPREVCTQCGELLTDDFGVCPCVFDAPARPPGRPKKGANMKTWGMREMVDAKLRRQNKR
jgi:hypothetical protein